MSNVGMQVVVWAFFSWTITLIELVYAKSPRKNLLPLHLKAYKKALQCQMQICKLLTKLDSRHI